MPRLLFFLLVEYLNDIVRMVRRDNGETKEVVKQLGAWSTLQKDLIPLITTYRDNKELVLPVCMYSCYGILFILLQVGY